MWSKFLLLYYTVIHLKAIQLFYQLWYLLKSKWPIKPNYGYSYNNVVKLKWVDSIFNLQTYIGDHKFRFLNIEHQFKPSIDWNFNVHKKLWTYNLNYFDYLNQETMTKTDGLVLMKYYVNGYESLKDGKDSYTTSLRLINWIKFVAKHEISDKQIFEVLREDANRLSKNLEYHLLGNHLLENGFALWFAAHLFKDKKFLQKASSILYKQLKEQVLQDGGHFELSPMYHNLLLYRLLDSIQLAEFNPNILNQSLVSYLRDKASKMLSWSKQLTFSNGEMPLFNDAANGVNPTPQDIMAYAKHIGLDEQHLELSDSGYRVFKTPSYELMTDVGQVGPSYQPAHAHADTFNFELHADGQPIIVDTGTSTYNIGATRAQERSTQAHNTVVICNQNSSQVWSGFRVAKRAQVSIIKDEKNNLSASHDGYSKMSVVHKRQWLLKSNEVFIKDSCHKVQNAKAYLHFHPAVDITVNKNEIFVNESIHIFFKKLNSLKLLDYEYKPEFNLSIRAKKVELIFNDELSTIIKL